MSAGSTVRALIEALDAGDRQRVLDLTTEDFESRSASRDPLSREAWLGIHDEVHVAFPSLRHHVLELTEHGDDVQLTVYATAVHDREVRLPALGVEPLPATGLAMRSLPHRDVYTVRDGRVAAVEAIISPGGGLAGLLEQIRAHLAAAPLQLDRFAEYADFEAHARAVLPRATYEHLAEGTLRNWTRDENRRAFDRWVFRKRLMVDVETIDLRTRVAGTDLALPVMLAPSAFHKLVHSEGELGSASAAAAMGSAIVLSTLSSTSLEAVAATGAACWLQLQIHRDRDLTLELARRAEAAGFKALALTLDAPTFGLRPADKRNHIKLPTGIGIANLADRPLPHHARGVDLMAYLWSEMDRRATWQDAAWLAERTSLPVVAKGVLSADHARRAVDAGAVGVIVSNQGGRQLDGDPATLDVLPEVVAAVGDRVDVLMDGGVRDGANVLKALALGARAVLIGRPIYWSLAAGGGAGVRAMLEILRDGLENAMQTAGVPRVADVTPDLVRPAVAYRSSPPAGRDGTPPVAPASRESSG